MTRVWVQGFDEIFQKFEMYRAADKRLKKLADDYASIPERETSYLSAMPRGGGGQQVPALQRYIETREQKRELLEAQLAKYNELFDEIQVMFTKLKGIQQQVIALYYIQGYPMRVVAIKLKPQYSERRCWDIRNEALCQIARMKKAGEKNGSYDPGRCPDPDGNRVNSG